MGIHIPTHSKEDVKKTVTPPPHHQKREKSEKYSQKWGDNT